MAEIIKTWPSSTPAREIAHVFSERAPLWSTYFFSLGRGKPHSTVSHIWFAYQGRILGRMPVLELRRNDGTNIPKLYRADGEGEWVIRPDVWVAIAGGKFEKCDGRLYMGGFRGWRYFDLASYRETPESKVRM